MYFPNTALRKKGLKTVNRLILVHQKISAEYAVNEYGYPLTVFSFATVNEKSQFVILYSTTYY